LTVQQPTIGIRDRTGGFLWGAATAAFQVEGAACEDGRGPSIWDVFLASGGRTARGETGAVTCDHYHRWREDVELMRQLNLQAYRFSISWPRVIPAGSGPHNEAGWWFYERLVDALLAAGIEPFVTLYHWDLPAALQTRLGGWANPEIAFIFADYAEAAFRRLGDRVRLWTTLNEPWVVVNAGYFEGVHPPGLRDRRLGFVAAHNLLRAHAHAVTRFRTICPDGSIGIVLNGGYAFAVADTPEDKAAAERAMVAQLGWFGDPACLGGYPLLLRERLGAVLPEFSSEEVALLKHGVDFIGLNYYFSEVVRHAPGGGLCDVEVVPQPHRLHTAMGWPVTPEGFCPLLRWLGGRYAGVPIYVTENGAAFDDCPDESGYVQDPQRIAYLGEHISAVQQARAEGVDVRGYFVWSLLDNLEWAEGFSKRFGIVRCDFETLRRTIKASGHWYARLIAEGGRVGEVTLDSVVRRRDE